MSAPPLSFVTWRWQSPTRYRSTFGPETVNIMRHMIARHYPSPHRFLCVTDLTEGLDPEVEVIPPWNDFVDLPSPSGGRNPSCYRRLRMFAPDIGDVFGPRFVSLDLDTVIVGDLRPLVDRPEDFVIWGDTNPKTFYNGSMILMTAGARPRVWTDFDPHRSPKAAYRAGHHGSDQAWISYCLGPNEAKWTKSDGVYSYQKHLRSQQGLPQDARIVVFHGAYDPWSPGLSQRHPWIAEHYQGREVAA